MTIKFEKKTYVAPKMDVVELKTNCQILADSCADQFGRCGDEGTELGSIGTFGNDKA